MNHFSLEVMGKERQKNLVQEQLREQSVREGRPGRRPSGIRFVLVTTSILLIYFWWIL